MLFGILGRKGAGKDTVADYMIQKYNFQKTAFAQPLKDACRVLFNFNEEQLFGNLKETIDPNWGTSPRTVLQWLGTDVIRNNVREIIPEIGDNFWVNLMSIKYKQMVSCNDCCNVVVSDVRFKNEVEEIHKLGGMVIKIIRPTINNIDMHESEKNIDILCGDYEIINDGTLEELYNKINNIIEKNVFKKP